MQSFQESYPAKPDSVDSYSVKSHKEAIRYIVSGYCLGIFRSLSHLDSKANQLLESINSIAEQRAKSDSSSLKAQELSLRKEYLLVYIEFIYKSGQDMYSRNHGSYMDGVSNRLVNFVCASGMGLMEKYKGYDHSPQFIEDLLRLAATVPMHLRKYTMNLWNQSVTVFNAFAKALKDGDVVLDPRYRHPLRDSMLKGLDKVFNQIPDSTWLKMFPPIATDTRHLNSKVYKLKGEGAYEWNLAENVPLEIKVTESPYTVQLEAHMIARIPVIYDCIQTQIDIHEGKSINPESMIALAICMGDNEFKTYCQRLGVAGDQYWQIKANAEADLSAICDLACGH